MLLTAMDLSLPMEKRKKAATDLMKEVGVSKFAELMVRYSEHADWLAFGFAGVTWVALIGEGYVRAMFGGFGTVPTSKEPEKKPDPAKGDNGEPLKDAEFEVKADPSAGVPKPE